MIRVVNKWTLSFFLLCISFSNPLLATPGNEFQISYPSDFPVEIVTDLKLLMEKLTSKSWSPVKEQTIQCGFILSINSDEKYKTGESCRIISNGKGLIRFHATTINGLIFGVYRHLRDNGFKFYLPDELYTILPEKTALFDKTDKIVTPHLRIRTFFGTGGFGSGATDPDFSVKKDWQRWMWQNGFGSEFELAGHVGETFNLNNADILEKNPSWTASPIKTNGQVNVATKLNYFNPDAVDFFTNWVIRKFTDKNYKPSASYIRDMVSIDPADGGGFKEGTATVKGVKLNTISDQVFFAANEAAKKLDKLFPNHPNIGVNLYAYSNHADVPNFKLNPRVFVQIIPYQFQNIAFGPAFIKRWSEKVTRFGLYDYFKYPDSNFDLPGGYSLDELMTRAMHAGNAGSEGTTYESSYSKFATAIPLWVLIRYMADGNMNWEEQYNQLIKDLYGKATPAIEKLFQLFYRQSKFGDAEIKVSYDQIQKAESINKSDLIKKRVEELKLYLSYVQVYRASQNLQTGNLEQRMLPVFKMAWTLYEKKIIHSYRIMQLASYAFLNTPGPDAATSKRYQELHSLTFPETADKNAFWKSDKISAMYSEKELTNLYQSNRIKSTATTTGTAKTNLSVKELIDESKKQFNAISNFKIQIGSYTRGYFSIYAEKPTEINISWFLTGDNPKPTTTISGTNKNYTAVYDKIISSLKGSYAIKIPAGESYFFINAADKTTCQLTINLNDSWAYFEPSPRTAMAFIDKNNAFSYQPLYYPTYFFVPKDITEIRYKVQVNALSIFSPDGKPATATTLHETMHGGFEIRSFKVEPQYRGKFWKAVIGGNYNYELLNIPNVWYMLEPK